MKYIILPILAVFLLLPGFSLAQTENNFRLPIYEDQKLDNENFESELLQSFGSDEYLACYDCQEEKNPFVRSACLRNAQYCLLGQETPEVQCDSGETPSAGICVSAQTGCQEEFGEFSRYSGLTTGNSYNCECQDGYAWNEDQTECSEVACPSDMLYYSPYKDTHGNYIHGRCMSLDEACQSMFGEYSEYSLTTNNEIYCSCLAGYELENQVCSERIIVAGIAGPEENELIYIETIEREQENIGIIDYQLSSRLAGRILLQVEEAGEAWYVNPDDTNKYFLSTPEKALEVMSKLGLGATHEFINSYNYYPDFVWGRILIDVEDLGKAYYISPLDKKAYYLGKPVQALNIFREQGLGITNNELRQIGVGDLED